MLVARHLLQTLVVVRSQVQADCACARVVFAVAGTRVIIECRATQLHAAAVAHAARMLQAVGLGEHLHGDDTAQVFAARRHLLLVATVHTVSQPHRGVIWLRPEQLAVQHADAARSVDVPHDVSSVGSVVVGRLDVVDLVGVHVRPEDALRDCVEGECARVQDVVDDDLFARSPVQVGLVDASVRAVADPEEEAVETTNE